MFCLADAMVCPLGMKTERKRTELGAATFVFIFFYGNRNEYRNPGNKYRNEYYQKRKRSEYGTDTDGSGVFAGTKDPLNHRPKNKETNKVLQLIR